MPVTWKVEGIRAIFLNGHGEIGEGQKTVCLNAGQPELRVQFPWKSVPVPDEIYVLPVQVLVNQPAFWLLLATSIGALMIAGRTAPVPGLSWLSRQLVTGWKNRRMVKLRKYGLILVSLMIALGIAAEVGLRFYFTRFGTQQDRNRYVYSVDEIRKMNVRYVPLPYVGYGLSPGFADNNSLGYRGSEITIPKPANTFRIVALGSSVTYGTGLQTDETYPAQLQTILREEYGYRNVEVINAGVPGYASWEYVIAFSFRILDLQPDLIIVYENTNDVTARLVDPDFYTGLNLMRGIWQREVLSLPSSTLYRFIAINLGWMSEPKIDNSFSLTPTVDIPGCVRVAGEQPKDACPELNDAPPSEILAANPPLYYERNLRTLAAVAAANQVQLMLSSWAYFPDPLPSNENQYMTYPDRQTAVAEANETLQRLGAELDIPFYDLAGNMPYNAGFWYDGRHMTPSGAHEQAALYAAFLDNNNLIPGE
ncbi:MAG: hypothetical protein K8I30_24255 [Anaerolineae bacterium]|nr:hypothetical protein [Anaerolineae bacterium]